MFKLHFDDYKNNIPHLRVEDQNELRQLAASIKGNVEIDVLWQLTKDIVVKYDPSLRYTIDAWKSDIIMSIFASVSNDIALPYSTWTIAKNIAKTEGCSSKKLHRKTEDNYHNFNTTLNNINEKIQTIAPTEINQFINFPNPRIQYLFESISSIGAWGLLFIEEKKDIKTIYPEDAYYYIKNIKEFPFWLSNLNGMQLYDWYKYTDILKKLEKIHRSDVVAKELSCFIFDQLFSVTDFSTLLAYYWSVYEKYFYDIDDPERERAIILSTVLAPLGKYVLLENVSISPVEISSYLKWYRSSEDSKNPKNEDLYQKLFQVLWYPYYYFPMCQSVMAFFLDVCFANLPSKQQAIYETLHKYIQQHIYDFNYMAQLDKAEDVFKALRYPSKGNPVTKSSSGKDIPKKVLALTERISHNSAADSFGTNFSYNFFQSMYDLDYFSFAHMSSRKKYLKIKKKFKKRKIARTTMIFIIQNPRSFIINKINNVDIRVRSTRNSYTANFIQRKNPHVTITIPYR